MNKTKTEQLLKVSDSLAEEVGYYRGYVNGVEDTLQRVSDWIDEDTLEYVRERLLGESNEKN